MTVVFIVIGTFGTVLQRPLKWIIGMKIQGRYRSHSKVGIAEVLRKQSLTLSSSKTTCFTAYLILVSNNVDEYNGLHEGEKLR